MKLIVILIFIVGVCGAIYLLLIHLKNFKKINWKAVGISSIFGLILLGFLAFAMYKASTAPDTWCSMPQTATSYPPAETVTAMDYFEKGNFDYDTGNCKGAIADYTKSIDMNFKYPQAYNNRAYTYMRMQDYKSALADLNKALEINPNYINALMNRGDIYNYYLNDKAKAITDYEKIISIAGTRGTSVCGHLAMAKHASKNPLTFFTLPFEVMDCRGLK